MADNTENSQTKCSPSNSIPLYNNSTKKLNLILKYKYKQ